MNQEHAACTDTKAVDMYALGVITMEMVLRSRPDDNHEGRAMQAVQALSSETVALLIEYKCTGVVELLTKCMSSHPSDRPNASQLLQLCWWPELEQVMVRGCETV